MEVALHTRLHPGAETAYEAAHQEVPPDLVAAIRAAGATRWRIWRSELELFHLVECEDYGRLLDELAGLPVNVAWQARMAELLEVVHDYGPAGADYGLPLVWEL